MPVLPKIVIEVEGGCVVAMYCDGLKESEVIVYDRDIEATCALDEHYGEQAQDSPMSSIHAISIDDLPDDIRRALAAMRTE